MWEVLQLGGVLPHFSHHVHAFLDREFPDHWIGRGETILWPPHSPDLTPLDFFSCGFVKDTIYCEKLQNVNEFNERTITAAGCVTSEMSANTLQDNEYCLDVCCASNGSHIEFY
jgi:hypothetical protein